MHARSVIAIAVVAIIVAGGCAGVPSTASPQPGPASPAPGAPAESSGPIVSLLVASEVDEKGAPVSPAFRFEPDAPQITVIARVGAIEPKSRLVVEWSRLAEPWSGDAAANEELFRHEIEVASEDIAWSIGRNPGTLAPGSYLVRATLAGVSQEVSFDVSAAPTASAEPTPPPAVTGQPASGSPPVSGASGTSQGATGGAPCDALYLETLKSALSSAGHWEDPDAREVDTPLFNEPGCGVAITSIAIHGQAPLVYASFPIDPCYLTGGSDLPGKTIDVGVTIGGTAFATQHIVLGADDMAPRLDVTSTPVKGKPVKEGDTITVTAVAEELRAGGPWQSGVALIQLLSTRPSQQLVDSKDFPTKRGIACDGKAWKEQLHATYTVPANPPSEIELCVVGEDWAGNGHERGAWKCATFPTDEKWEGTIHSSSTSKFSYLGAFKTCTEEWQMTLALTVHEGKVEGSGTGDLVATTACQASTEWDFGRQARHLAFDVRGTKSERQFDLELIETSIDGTNEGLLNYSLFFQPSFEPQPLAVPVTRPGVAEADISIVESLPAAHDQASGTHAIRLVCKTCDPGVG